MTSYQPHAHVHPLAGRREEIPGSVNSLDSSWIIAELARATHENVFSDSVSSPVSDTRHTVSPQSEPSAEEVSLSQPFRTDGLDSWSPYNINDSFPHSWWPRRVYIGPLIPSWNNYKSADRYAVILI